MKRLIFSILILLAVTAGATTYYVSPSGDNSDGTTWAKAFTTLGAAISPSHAGDTVYVTNGNYGAWSASKLTNAVTWVSVNGPSVTTINAGANLYALYTQAGTFSGFTLSNATQYGAAIIMPGETVVFSNCVFADNAITLYGPGGGLHMYAAGATAKVYNCTFSKSTTSAPNGGGAVGVIDGTTAWLSDCVFTGNTVTTANEDGGAIQCDAAGIVYVNRCTFQYNRTTRDGAAINNWSSAGNVSVSNSLFVGNYAGRYAATVRCIMYNSVAYGNSDDGGLAVANDGQFYNCTFIGNYSADSAYAVVWYADMENCILWGNYPRDWSGSGTISNTCYGLKGADGSQVIVSSLTNYPQFQSDYTANPTAANTGTNFVLTSISNLMLQSSSPCINTGTNQPWMVGALDYAGQGRINSNSVDMGAFEYYAAEAPAGSGQRHHWRIFIQ